MISYAKRPFKMCSIPLICSLVSVIVVIMHHQRNTDMLTMIASKTKVVIKYPDVITKASRIGDSSSGE